MVTDTLDVTGIATQAMDGISSFVWPVLWSLIGILVLVFVYWFLQFRHTVRVKILTSNGHTPVEDKAREVTVDNTPFWQLRKRKHLIPVPPREALDFLGLDFLRKPKFFAEMYYSEEHGYIPCRDNVSKENLVDILAQSKDNTVTGSYQPLTPAQRALYTSQLRKAVARKNTSILDKITQFATPLMLVMVLVLVLLFWEDIAKPSKDMASINQAMLSQNERLVGQVAEVSAQNARMLQVIAGDLQSKGISINQRVPPDTGGST